jgi:hypothetical protein
VSSCFWLSNRRWQIWKTILHSFSLCLHQLDFLSRVALGLRSPEYNQIFGGITWYNSISYNSLTYIYILTTSLGRKLTFQNAVHPFHAPTSAWEL